MIITEPDTTSATTPTRPARDLRGFWRIALALTLPLGPLLITVFRGVMPYWTSDDPTTAVSKIAAAPELMNTLLMMSVALTPLMIVTVLTLGYVARRGAPVLATIGTALSFAAYTVGAATANPDYVTTVLSQSGYSVGQIVTLTNQLNATAVATITGLFWVAGHIIGAVILAIALGRARVLPLWGALLMALSQPMHLVAAVIVPSRLLDVTLGWGLTTFTCALVSVWIFRTRNDNWDLSPGRWR